ncbi:MAG TPA: class I adenylate-forming enzyme family protein [Opitutaceae bacterium]|nr:class I adenylate-forming enzyme family protein [Opitutaceae bacterium]
MSEDRNDLLSTWARLVEGEPNATALVEAAENRVWTRKELDEASREWADRVSDPALLEGAGVGFALPNNATWFAAYLGLLRCGAVPIPLDSSEPLENQRALAAAGGARFVWNGATLETLEGAGTRFPADTCVVKLTSGTTGTPRALAFKHREMLADGRQICATMSIRPSDTNLAIVPFGHSYGLGNLVVPLLDQGTSAICVSAPLPHAIAADAAKWKPTIFPAVPALLRVLALSALDPKTFESVRTVVSAGSALSADVANQFYQKYHAPVHGFYGSSETGGISYDRSGEATLAGRSVGQPMEGVRIVPAAGQRFWVESAAVYTRKNAARRTAGGHGRFRPADRGELDARGELVLLGRAGRMLKIAGRRIDLTELEQSLRKISGIRDAYVVPHPHKTEELAAALATDFSIEAARTVIRAALAAWKVPRRILVFHEFPLTSRGKTDTASLREALGKTGL